MTIVSAPQSAFSYIPTMLNELTPLRPQTFSIMERGRDSKCIVSNIRGDTYISFDYNFILVMTLMYYTEEKPKISREGVNQCPLVPLLDSRSVCVPQNMQHWKDRPGVHLLHTHTHTCIYLYPSIGGTPATYSFSLLGINQRCLTTTIQQLHCHSSWIQYYLIHLPLSLLIRWPPSHSSSNYK